MKIKPGADIKGLRNIMRAALHVADGLWESSGRSEGVTITCGLDGVHSARSLHPCGLALDLRTRYFTRETAEELANRLRIEIKAMDQNYGVVFEGDHIHIQWRPPQHLEHYY